MRQDSIMGKRIREGVKLPWLRMVITALTSEEDLVRDNQQQLEHENWSVDWKDYCDMLVKTWQQGRHKTRNNFLDSSEPMRTFRNTIPILIFRISNALGIVSLRPDIIYDFENVNLNLDVYLILMLWAMNKENPRKT